MKKIVEEVSENELAYGAQCPVAVEGEDGSTENGTVLLCNPSSSDPRKIVYVIMVMVEGIGRYEEGVDAGRVRYRRSGAQVAVAPVSASDGPILSGQKVKPTESKDLEKSLAKKSAAKAAEVTPEKELVPTSMAFDEESCEDNSLGKATAGSEACPGPNNVSPPAACLTKNHALSAHSGSHNTSRGQCNQYCYCSADSFSRDVVGSSREERMGHNESSFEMKIPAWLQKNREAQRNLFCKWDY